MNNLEWLDHMTANKAKFSMFANLHSWKKNSHWDVSMELQDGPVELKISCAQDTHVRLDSAISDIRRQYDRVTSGDVRFDGPMLEYDEENDEIPF